jgi:hypothetical protein
MIYDILMLIIQPHRVISDFVSFPSSAPLWVEFGLSWAFSIMWLACAILAIEVGDANFILAFIVFGCGMCSLFHTVITQGADMEKTQLSCTPSSSHAKLCSSLPAESNRGLVQSIAWERRGLRLETRRMMPYCVQEAWILITQHVHLNQHPLLQLLSSVSFFPFFLLSLVM